MFSESSSVSLPLSFKLSLVVGDDWDEDLWTEEEDDPGVQMKASSAEYDPETGGAILDLR